MGAEAIELLHADIDARPAVGGVVDGEARAGRRLEPRRRLTVQTALVIVGNQRSQRRGELAIGELAERRLARQRGREPLVEPGNQCLVGQVRDGGINAAQEDGPSAQTARLVAPGQCGQPTLAHFVKQRLEDQRRVGAVDDPLLEHQAAQRHDRLGLQPAAGVALQARLAGEAIGEGDPQLARVELGGQQDAVARLAAAELGHRQPRRLRERLGRLHEDAAAAGELEVAGRPARLGDPLGPRLGEQQGVAERGCAGGGARFGGPAARELAGIAGALASVAAERLQTQPQIDVAAAEATFDDQRGDARGALALAGGGGAQHHMGKPRRQGDVGHAPAVVGQRAGGIERPQPLQQDAGLGHRGGRRPVEEGQAGAVARAPERQVERHAGKIGLEDLRTVEGREPTRLALVP